MATPQLKRPEERDRTTIASAQPQETYYASDAPNARSVTVRFDITGTERAVRYFLNAVVHTRSLEALQFFIENYRSQLQHFTATIGMERVSMDQIVPAIKRRLESG